ncbi:MAG: FMN-binding protein [Butyrivibrio sp.]|nr:FMN-binding protein [Butyrivibrio sp.]
MTLLVLVADEVLRKKPLPFYLGAILLASVSVAFSWNGIRILEPMVAKGALTGAFFTLVMFAGAFPQGSFGAKTFMPVRAQLSIMGSIFAISHGLSLGKPYFIRLLSGIAGAENPGFDVVTILSLTVAAGLMLIMLPLFITSFKMIRKKMNPKAWKNLQRFAYLFYALMYLHILAFEIPKAMRGTPGYAVNVFAYSLVFLSYLFCRILRSAYKNKKEVMAKMQIIAVMGSLLITTVGTLYITGYAADKGKEAMADLPEVAGASITDKSNEQIASDTMGKSDYADGTYHGTGMGNNGKIGVDVTISDGTIKEIQITDFPDDPEYFDVDKDGASMIQEMLKSQNAEVDTVSGATYSSEGLIDAVNDALSKAISK